MLEEFRDIAKVLKIDTSSWVTLLCSLVVVVIPFVSKIINIVESIGKYSIWNLHKKYKDTMFFAYIIYLEYAYVFIAMIVFALINQLLIAFKVLNIIQKFVLLIILIFEIIINVISFIKIPFIRKKIIENRKAGKIMLIFLAIIAHSYFFMGFYRLHNIWTVGIELILLIVIEIWGLKTFKGYIQYQYSSVIIYLSNGEKVDCKDISKIKKKHNYFIITEKNKEVRIKYETIVQMKYYGSEIINLIK